MSEKTPPVPIKLPITTIITVVLTLLLIRVAEMIAPIFLPLVISILIAVALTPFVKWFQRKNIPRGIAIAIPILACGLSVAILVYFIAPRVYREAVAFMENLPELREQLLKNVGANNPVHSFLSKGLQKDALAPKADQVKQVLVAGNVLLGGLAELVIIFVMTVYLVIDGPRIFEWLTPFFDIPVQRKIIETKTELSKIISAYIVGQVITSVLSFAFVLVALMSLGVPNSLLLATLAGILDILPVLGFVLAVIPAMLFAVSVSVSMPWIVLGLYLFYHALENYVIVPFVYGNRMRVSSFVVFIALFSAGLVGGIEGAIVILPIVASYPIIERIWLKRFVREEALLEHSMK